MIHRKPYTLYAVQLPILSPPAIVADVGLFWLLNRSLVNWPASHVVLATRSLLVWMFFSKFVKFVPHFARHPGDVLLWPISVIFGWLYGLIKLYALATLLEASLPFVEH